MTSKDRPVQLDQHRARPNPSAAPLLGPAVISHLLEQSLKVGKPGFPDLAGSIRREHGGLCFQDCFNRQIHGRHVAAAGLMCG
jgi:hypothetical protein